jgi:NhaA family Na+:H+ antiporter
VIAGLVVGKLTGIAGATWLAVRARVGRLPSGVGMAHVLGAGAVGGIGFTVSLFVTGLAFDSEALQAEATIGILIGSLVAAVLGAVLVRRAGPRQGGTILAPNT